ELKKNQFDAAVQLLTQQRPFIKEYWALASEENQLFQARDVVVGAAWPYQTIQLKAAGVKVDETIPSEGATGWGDTWMLATKAPHPNCAYLWTQYVSTAKVQAEQALFFGETPVNTKACGEMEALQAGSCAQYHASEPGSYIDTIHFWKTPQTIQVWTTTNFERILNEPVYHDIVGRTVLLAALVTLTDAVLAFPFAYYMARVASRRVQTLLFAAVLLPLWASYLARVYAWILILNHSGLLNWSLQSIGLPPANIGYTNVAMWVVFSYIWLPFMIIPTYAALERVPESLVEASADLGARRWRTIRDIVLPLALPGVVAGSIFTFSLTLGDYITPVLVGGAG